MELELMFPKSFMMKRIVLGISCRLLVLKSRFGLLIERITLLDMAIGMFIFLLALIAEFFTFKISAQCPFRNSLSCLTSSNLRIQPRFHILRNPTLRIADFKFFSLRLLI